MLRIHHIVHDGEPRLALEGKLVGPWVEECRGILARAEPDDPPFLDLREVHFADAAGVALLEELEAAGRIRSRSRFLTELLRKELRKEEEKQP